MVHRLDVDPTSYAETRPHSDAQSCAETTVSHYSGHLCPLRSGLDASALPHTRVAVHHDEGGDSDSEAYEDNRP
jgi:hypothetical protein